MTLTAAAVVSVASFALRYVIPPLEPFKSFFTGNAPSFFNFSGCKRRSREPVARRELLAEAPDIALAWNHELLSLLGSCEEGAGESKYALIWERALERLRKYDAFLEKMARFGTADYRRIDARSQLLRWAAVHLDYVCCLALLPRQAKEISGLRSLFSRSVARGRRALDSRKAVDGRAKELCKRVWFTLATEETPDRLLLLEALTSVAGAESASFREHSCCLAQAAVVVGWMLKDVSTEFFSGLDDEQHLQLLHTLRDACAPMERADVVHPDRAPPLGGSADARPIDNSPKWLFAPLAAFALRLSSPAPRC